MPISDFLLFKETEEKPKQQGQTLEQQQKILELWAAAMSYEDPRPTSFEVGPDGQIVSSTNAEPTAEETAKAQQEQLEKARAAMEAGGRGDR